MKFAFLTTTTMPDEEGKSEKFGDAQAKDFIKEYNQETYGETTTNNEISAANHQAKNDYQDDGEPFGSLSNRNRSEKEDVPSKEED
jgi:hypothetical protein